MFLQRFHANLLGRDFAVGDIHGHYDEFMEALKAANFNPKSDRVFSVGDLVDRGPRSFDTLKLAYEDWFKPIAGNHEDMMRKALKTRDDQRLLHWFKNGGNWVVDEDAGEVFQVGLDILDRMPMAIEVEVDGKLVGLIHAEPPPSWNTIREQADSSPFEDSQLSLRSLWSRERINKGDTSPVRGIDMVVCGHTIVSGVGFLGNVAYIDTGAYREEGHLTLVEIKDLLQWMP